MSVLQVHYNKQFFRFNCMAPPPKVKTSTKLFLDHFACKNEPTQKRQKPPSTDTKFLSRPQNSESPVPLLKSFPRLKRTTISVESVWAPDLDMFSCGEVLESRVATMGIVRRLRPDIARFRTIESNFLARKRTFTGYCAGALCLLIKVSGICDCASN